MHSSCYLKLREALEDCQRGFHSHDKHLNSLRSIYNTGDKVEFCETFIGLMKYPMTVLKREPSVERTIKFIAKFITSIATREDDNTQIAECVLFVKVLNFLLEAHEANSKAVRFRACHLIADIMHNLGDVELDEDLCDRIYQAMLTRLSDKVPGVRICAVQALCRLQDPTDKKCPIMKAFLFLMSKDPNAEVRVACLRNLAPTSRTLVAILERTRDVNDLVRKTAYSVLSEKVSVKALTIAQRLTLLESGLKDRSLSVQAECTDKLLQAWLSYHRGNIHDLLSALDVLSSGPICEKAIMKILSKVPSAELLDGFDSLNHSRVICTDKLNCESVFYWHMLCKHIHALGEGESEKLEKILPDTKDFISYIVKFASESLKSPDEEQHITNEYILQQLVLIVKYLDLSDPVSRKSVVSMCRDLLQSDDLGLPMIPYLVECLKLVVPSPAARISELAEVISEVQQPTMCATHEEPVQPEQLHKLKVKLANLNMKLNELSEQMAEEVRLQNFSSAAELKEQLALIETSKKALLEELKPKQVVIPSQVVRTDEVTRLKCLAMFSELMRSSDIVKLTDVLRSFLDQMVLPAIPDPAATVRKQAVTALGQCCLCDLDCARKNILILVQIAQLDEEAIRVAALEAIFDMIQTFGVECFQSEPDEPAVTKVDSVSSADLGEESDLPSDTPSSDGYQASAETGSDSDNINTANRTANSLIHLLVGLLDDESSDVRSLAAEGLAKLLLSGRVVSSKLLSRLFILWYNPVTEGDTRLRHCLGVFFPVYAFASRAYQVQVEDAFLPTLKVIFDAPNTSPLSDIDENNVAELLVQLTSHRQLVNKEPVDTETMSSHDSLAIKICNEMLANPNTYGITTLSKILGLLDISVDNEILVKDLCSLLNQITKLVKEKQALKHAEKVAAKLRSFMKNAPAHDDISGSDTVVADPEEEADNAIDNTVLDVTQATRLKRGKPLRKDSNLLSDTVSSESDSSTAGLSKTKLPKLKSFTDSD